MILDVSISIGKKIVTIESSKTKLIDLLSWNFETRNTKNFLYVSSSTNKYCRDELENIYGTDLDENIAILPDAEFPFGTVKVKSVDNTTGDVSWEVLELFKEAEYYDYVKLQEEIVMNSPTFLITNMATWAQIATDDFENVDKFVNGAAYYHSYCKVPVAISEFVDPGMVKLVID